MRSFNNIFFVLFSLLFAAACGNGDGNGPAPCDCQGKADCSCPETDGGTDGTDGSVPLTCSNGTCDQGETCANCLTDCPCQEGEECKEGKCEVEGYVCPSEIPPPEQQEACTPAEAKNAGCADEGSGPICNIGFFAGQPCATSTDCQVVPKDAWPPCVCWGLPCELTGNKWEEGCDSLNHITIEDGNNYCQLHFDNRTFYYKPENDYIQFPPDGPFEEKITLKTDGTGAIREGPMGIVDCAIVE